MSTDTKRDKCSGGSRNCAAVSGVGSDPDLSPAPKENGPRVTAVESSPGGTGPPPACAARHSRASRASLPWLTASLWGIFALYSKAHPLVWSLESRIEDLFITKDIVLEIRHDRECRSANILIILHLGPTSTQGGASAFSWVASGKKVDTKRPVLA